MIGKAISFVLSFLVSGVGIVKALGILDLLRESKVLSAVCTKVAKGAVASKEALAKTLEAAAELWKIADEEVDTFISRFPTKFTTADKPRLVQEAFESLQTKVYKGVEMVGETGSLGEFDTVDTVRRIFIEDKSALGLSNPLNQQTPLEWAMKQIFEKTQTRINNLAKTTSVRPSAAGNGVVPKFDEIKNFKDFTFKIDADTPALRQAVENAIRELKVKFPDFNFNAIYGG
jgi:hypothetical protein